MGGLEGPLKEIAPLLEDRLDLVPASEIPLGKVSEVILVDNARPERIGPFKVLVGRVPSGSLTTIRGARGRARRGGRVQEVGATVSLLLPFLKERGLALTPLEATLAYAGVWEDTGGFSFPSTTPLDLEAAHHLASWGRRSPGSGPGCAPIWGRRPGASLRSF